LNRTQNYTEVGYKKIKAPLELFGMLTDFWEKNKGSGKVEKWGIGNTYTYVPLFCTRCSVL